MKFRHPEGGERPYIPSRVDKELLTISMILRKLGGGYVSKYGYVWDYRGNSQTWFNPSRVPQSSEWLVALGANIYDSSEMKSIIGNFYCVLTKSSVIYAATNVDTWQTVVHQIYLGPRPDYDVIAELLDTSLEIAGNGGLTGNFAGQICGALSSWR